MYNIKTRFILNTIFFFLVYVLMVYIIIRAFNIGITHDEAYSFYNVKHFWYVETLCTGNTHWFNFLAMKAAVLLGLEKVSQLRWFSLFSAGVFLTCIYFWLKTLKAIPIKILAFCIILLNPYIIDYLSLARGYSSGLAFEAMSILCYYIAIKNKARHLAFLSLFCAGMSAIANFNFFYFFTAFSIIYFYNYYFSTGLKNLKTKSFFIDGIFAVGISILVLKALYFIKLCSNDIGAFGGEDLAPSIFTGYIYTLIYNNVETSINAINIVAYIVFAAIISASIYGILKVKKHGIVWYSIASKLFLWIIILLVFNKWCLGVLYPTFRTALLFYPLIALITIGFLSSVFSNSKIKNGLIYVCSALLFLNFTLSFSLNKTFDYNEQHDSKACFTFLDDIGAKHVGINPFLFGVYRNYYQQTDAFKYSFTGECLNSFTISRPNYANNKLSDFDYLVLYPPYNMSFYKNQGIRLKGMKYYKSTGTLVVRVIH